MKNGIQRLIAAKSHKKRKKISRGFTRIEKISSKEVLVILHKRKIRDDPRRSAAKYFKEV